MSIDYIHAADIGAVIDGTSARVVNLTYAEAAAALGANSQQAGPTVISTFPLIRQTGGTPVTLEAQYAAQTWQYYKTALQGAGITSLGAAGAAALEWAQGVIIGTGEGLAATGGVLTLSAPVAVAAAAPLLGVGLGYALYESNPELWTKISDKVVGGFGNAITAVIDAAGKVYVPKSLIDDLKEVFDEEGIPTSGSSSGGGVIYTGSGTIPYYSSIEPTSNYKSVTGQIMIPQDYPFAGKTSFRCYSNNSPVLTGIRTDDSVRTWEGRNIADNWYAISVAFDGTWGPTSTGFTDSDIINGTIVPDVPGEYQPGTSQWGGTTPSTIPTLDVYNPATQSTEPYYPVQIPLGDVPAGSSPDPELQPDPTAPTPPELVPYLDPYIAPVIDPTIQWPEELPLPGPDELQSPGVKSDPIYLPSPDLDPAINPSTVPEVDPDSLASNLSEPQSSGESPDPQFPVPGVPFPSWTPTGSSEPVVSGQPGFIQVYNPTGGEFITFGRWLWVTYADSTIDKIWNNPFDGVIGAHELYATPSKDGYSTIRCGFLDSGISSIVVNQRYTEINCGSIVIPEYWGNYLDYSPYTQVMVYLPFIGIVSLEADDIVGSAVNILYHIDSYNGSCIAQITCARDNYENTLYQFNGNCAVEIPLSGGSQAQIKAGMMTADAYQTAGRIGAIASLIGGIASIFTGSMGGIVSGATGFASGLATAQAQHTANMLSGKSIVQHSGSFGSSHGAMGIKKPYIIIRRPIQKVVNGYNELYGYPAHKQVIIGACTGFLRCREVHVLSSLATDEEKTLIEELLKTGVYVTE